jgi:hypothetical protein
LEHGVGEGYVVEAACDVSALTDARLLFESRAL